MDGLVMKNQSTCSKRAREEEEMEEARTLPLPSIPEVNTASRAKRRRLPRIKISENTVDCVLVENMGPDCVMTAPPELQAHQFCDAWTPSSCSDDAVIVLQQFQQSNHIVSIQCSDCDGPSEGQQVDAAEKTAAEPVVVQISEDTCCTNPLISDLAGTETSAQCTIEKIDKPLEKETSYYEEQGGFVRKNFSVQHNDQQLEISMQIRLPASYTKQTKRRKIDRSKLVSMQDVSGNQ